MQKFGEVTYNHYKIKHLKIGKILHRDFAELVTIIFTMLFYIYVRIIGSLVGDIDIVSDESIPTWIIASISVGGVILLITVATCLSCLILLRKRRMNDISL